MTCRDVIDFLMDYMSGELPPDERARFDGHLGKCPECVAYLSTYRRSVDLGKAACADCDAIPESLVRAILAARATSRELRTNEPGMPSS